MTQADTMSERATKAARARPAKQFYRDAVDRAALLIEAAEIEGIDQEVALLRVKLQALMREEPSDYALMLRGVELIVRAVAARYRMSPRRAEELGENVSATLASIGDQFFQQRFADV